MKNNVLAFDFTVDKSTHTVHVKREFAAEQALVWDAFTRQELLDQWWAPKPWQSKTRQMDFKVGGRRFYAMCGPAGEEHWAIQEFTKIAPITNFGFTDLFSDAEGKRNMALPSSEWNLDFSETNAVTTVSISIKHNSLADLEQIIQMGFKEGFTMTLNELEQRLSDKFIDSQFKPVTKITINADIAADISKVWDYWTRPEHITKWNFASDDWHCPEAENDLRVGGKMKSRMEARDGSFGFDFEAIYDEVTDQSRIVYTMSDGRQAATDFEQLGGNTHIRILFDAEDQNPAEMQQAGWQAILNSFKKYTETH